jgi:DNA repair protein RecN (Recombination protein N)
MRRDAQRRLLDEFGDHAALLAPLRQHAAAWRRSMPSGEASPTRRPNAARASSCCATRSTSSRRWHSRRARPRALAEEQARLANRGRLAEAARAALALAYEGDGADAHALASRAAAQLRQAAALDPRLADPARSCSRRGDRPQGGRPGHRRLPRRARHGPRPAGLGRAPPRGHRGPGAQAPRRARRAAGPARALGRELGRLENSEIALAGLERQLAELRPATTRRPGGSRPPAARRPRSSRAVTRLMAVLGMPGGRLEIEVAAGRAATCLPPTADDSVDFLVTANPGQPAAPSGASPRAANCRASASPCRWPRRTRPRRPA